MLSEWLDGRGSCEGLRPGGLRGDWTDGWNSGCGLPACRDCDTPIDCGSGCKTLTGWNRGCDVPFEWGRGCDAPFGWGRGCGAPYGWNRGCSAPFGWGHECGTPFKWGCACGSPVNLDCDRSEQWNFGDSPRCNCGASNCACGYRWCECPECNQLGGYGDGPCGGYISYWDRYYSGR